MKFQVHENYKAALLIAVVLASVVNLVLKGYIRLGAPINTQPNWAATWDYIMALFIAILVIAFVSQVQLTRRTRLIEKTQEWLIDTVNWNIERLKAGDAEGKAGGKTEVEAAITTSHWPWGAHHTETLGHLEAAARKWWVLYDPRDFTTAPTNEMVSDWLQTERGISREKARAIASMLRPDGLPTGPRRYL